MRSTLNSVYDVEWKPRVVIEASAGTGKTYTIVALFVRLLIEKKLDVSQILVMTFTKKATSELRGRIFEQLSNCLRMLKKGTEGEDDIFLNEFYDRISDREEAARRLEHALRNVDEIQISTIHGFCQKVLSEEALLAGMPMEIEVVQDDELLTTATGDFWRQFINKYSTTEEGKFYISKLMSMAKNPAELRDIVRSMISKPYARIEGEKVNNPMTYIGELLRLRKQMKEIWEAEREEIERQMYNNDLRYYTEKNVRARITGMAEFMADVGYRNDTFDKLKFFTSDLHQDPDNLKKNGTEIPSHTFFDVCSIYHEKAGVAEQIKTTVLLQAFDEIKKLRKESSINSPSMTYDDLLINLQNAVEGVGGEELSERIRQKYPFALVDEFQDTDPVQYRVLDTVYRPYSENCGLFMIGDPKQAIYAFRGADVFTYLEARKTATHVYTLRKNYRSTPLLVDAVNHLFGAGNKPFIEDRIDYFHSECGRPETANEFVDGGQEGGFFNITALRGEESNKGVLKESLFQQMVYDIASLVERGSKGEVLIEGAPLRPGDIAILVAGHKDADFLKKELKQIGIESVTQSRQEVFKTEEAEKLAQLMAAVLDPVNSGGVNSALVTGFFGLELNQLYMFTQEGGLRDAVIEELQELRRVWNDAGFNAMFRRFIYKSERLLNVAKMVNADRVITNLNHLAEILSKTELDSGMAPHSLYSWFKREMADPGADEERNLLLETDQDLVQIITIHKSKGLQFPVVFSPVLWEWMDRGGRQLLCEYHSLEDDNLVINAGQYASGEREAALQLSKIEAVAEEVRKAYVAITRARYGCHLYWGAHTHSNYSGLGALIAGKELVAEFVQNNSTIKKKGGIESEQFEERLKKLHDSSGGTISLSMPDSTEIRAESVKIGRTKITDLSFRRYKGRPVLPVQRKLESFSSLFHHHSDAGQPDYDQVLEDYVTLLGSSADPEMRTPFSFPRGAVAGTALHKMFEHDDFDFTTAPSASLSGLIEEVLERYQIDVAWSNIAEQMMKNVVGSDIPGVNLWEIKKEDHLKEMEFHFPAGDVSTGRLLRIIREGSPSETRLEFSKSMMTGFIDLVVQSQGKFYILDYKSNYLGDSYSDYTPTRLEGEIRAAGYDLQYHLYTVALKKYMEKRLPGFEYDAHFGGVAYLFLRGMKKGSDNGIWFHKPSVSVIQQLEKELNR